MKKEFCLIVLLLIACSSIVAQEQALGLQIGYAQPSLREPKTQPGTSDFSNKTLYKGFKAGVVYEGTIIKGFGTFFALDYNFGADITKWKKSNSQFGNAPMTRTNQQFHSLSLRSDWQYKFMVAKETYLLLYTGPVIDWNASITKSEETKYSTGEIERKTVNRLSQHNQDDYPQLLRYNIKWGIGAGFQYQRYFLRGGYDFGIVNNYKHSYIDADTQVPMKTRCRLDEWHVSVGIYLWQSKN